MTESTNFLLKIGFFTDHISGCDELTSMCHSIVNRLSFNKVASSNINTKKNYIYKFKKFFN